MSHHDSHSKMITLDQVTLPQNHWLRKMPTVAGAVGVLGLIATFVLGMSQPEQAHFSFHVAFLYFLTIALGGLFFVLIQFATKAGWSVVVRRFAENLMGTLPIFVVLFIPMIFGAHTLFHWTHQEVVVNDPILTSKAPFLNTTFFFIRAAIYFIAWIWLARFFGKKSLEQDKTGVADNTRKMQHRSYAGIPVFALSVTFAAFDWIMSLDPHWYSTIFGVYIFAGCVVSIYASLIVLITATRGSGFLQGIINAEHFHDLGKMLFGFVVFWSYIAFSQFFLIWYGNIPEETLFYAHRLHGNWNTLSIVLAAGHFALPFFFLLPRTIKRNPTTLVIGASYMLVLHFVDIYWLVMPTLQKENASFGLLDVTSILGVGGVFLAMFAHRMRSNAVVPLKDPRLKESLAFENI